MSRETGQLTLFGEPDDATEPAGAAGVEPHVSEADRALAARLPPWIRFGTSSWSFPGWAGIVYAGGPRPLGEQALARDGLRAYAQHPLLRTVGLDRSYYAPLRAEELAAYAAQLGTAEARAPDLPPFRMVSKVWDEITTAVFPRHPRYGARAGQRNPSFLDPGRFLAEVLEPYTQLGAHTGPFVFELTPMPPGTFEPRELARKVGDLLARLPSGSGRARPRWAMELRNRELFGDAWVGTLREHGAAHVFTYWTAMPSLREQLARVGAPTADFVIARLMLPPFSRYAEKKAEYAPFDRLVAPQPEMREDLVDLVRRAAEHGASDVFILVNNKAEGSAPLTIRELAARVADAL